LMDRTVQTVTASSTPHPRPLPHLGSAETRGQVLPSVRAGVWFSRLCHQNDHACHRGAQFTACSHLLRTRALAYPGRSVRRPLGLRARSPRAQRISQNYCSMILFLNCIFL
jgi:hypothetical protein